MVKYCTGVLNSLNHVTTLVACPFDLGLIPFMRSHMVHTPNDLAVRGLGSLMFYSCACVAVMCLVIGLSMEKWVEARF
jgi:hypothetical protein